MPKKYHPKLIIKRKPNGEEFYLDYKDGLGKRRFKKAHDGVCKCGQTEKQRAKRPCQHYAAALASLADLKARTGQGAGERDSDVQTFKARYESHLDSSDKAPGTVELYKHTLKLWAEYCQSAGIRLLSQFNREHLDAWADGLKNSGIKNATVNLHLRNLRAALNRAVQWGMAKDNPASARRADGATPFRKTADSKKINYLTRPEIAKLLETEKPGSVRDMIILFLNCGLRLSELRFLRWENWRGDSLHIHSRSDFRTKSEQGNRLIPLNIAAKAALERRAEEKQSEFIFPSPNGGPLSKRTIQGYLERRYSALGIKGAVVDAPVNVHTLRHTFATSMLYLGTPLVVLRDLMGHADIQTTMRYVHLMPGESRSYIQKLTFEESGPEQGEKSELRAPEGTQSGPVLES